MMLTGWRDHAFATEQGRADDPERDEDRIVLNSA
jgi:hypothetical protein